jgi:glycosyltransferase involved in cell wall biosynthesis
MMEPEIQYIIIGNGVCEARVKKKIIEEGIKNITMFPLQPEEDSAFVYSLGDIGLVTLKQRLHEYAMPSKTWTMMSASQPIICTAEINTQLYEIIVGTEAGVIITPGDSQGLARQIMDLYHNRDRLKTYGLNGRAFAEMNLTRENATTKYFMLLKELAEGRQRFV